MKKPVNIKVEGYSGFRAGEYPKYFFWDNNRFEILEITDRWYQGANNPETPVANYFKVDTTCGLQFILKHIIEIDEWYLCQ
ncbi:MAG: cytoplasmic protein [Bacteroidales bacterium]|nr:cytoplasmic protein [Bacteroidales bacterium]MBK8881408.1 cytoplasmic protein [Bacteroidales bacterium]